MYKLILSFALACLCFISCKKDDSAPVTPVPAVPDSMAGFVPFAKGNYWIYQRFSADSAGHVVSVQPELDSLCVSEEFTGGASQLRFQLYKVSTNATQNISQSLLPFYPLGILADSGNYYQISKGSGRFLVSKLATPFSFPDYYGVSAGDTIYLERLTLRQMANPIPGNINEAVMLEYKFPTGYFVQNAFTHHHVFIRKTGIYQFEVSSTQQPYPNMTWRLLRHKVN